MMRKRTSIRKTLCVEQLESRLCPSTYSVVDLGTLGGTSSVAEDINVSGQVVGQAYTPGNVAAHAFLWQNGPMTDLGTLGGQNSSANALNKFAQVVGPADTGAVDASGQAIHHAFLWQNGAKTDLGTLGGPDSEAYDINSSAQVVGRSDTGAVDANGFKVQHAFVSQNGVMTDLNNQLPANSGWVLWWSSGINDNGQIAGVGSHNGLQRAFLFSSGVITDLGTLGATSTNSASRAHGINNSGQVVGLSSTNNNEGRGFLYSGGVMTELGALTGGSSSGSEALAINSSARVVGQSYSVQNGGVLGGTHAVLWQNGTKTDINKLIPSNSGWVLRKASGINDIGYIVGYGTISSQSHAFLAIPGSPLLAAAAPIHGATSATSITVSQVQPLISEAIARWAAAGVNTSMLGNIQVAVADLPGQELGLASGHTIWLDSNAAGWGWFVDRTPRSDSEFTTPGNQGEQHRMDLLTVLEHELGHVLGFEHQETGVMEDTLTTGTRRVPSYGIDTGTSAPARDILFAWFAANDDLPWNATSLGHRRTKR